MEREHLLPLAEEGMDLARITFPTVNSLGTRQAMQSSILFHSKLKADICGG
jgi:hypothetical protein